MDREGFRNRLKQYKKAREENPGLKYWEWKDIPKYAEGVDGVSPRKYRVVGRDPEFKEAVQSAIDWTTNWHDARKATGEYDEQYESISPFIKRPTSIIQSPLGGDTSGTFAGAFENATMRIDPNVSPRWGGTTESAIVHELAHETSAEKVAKGLPISQAKGSTIIDKVSEITGSPKFHTNEQGSQYENNAVEEYARLQQMRHAMKADPTKKYSLSELKSWLKKFFLPDDERGVRLMNEVAQADINSKSRVYTAAEGGVVPKYDGGTDGVKDNTYVAPIEKEQVFIPATGATKLKQDITNKLTRNSQIKSGAIDIVSPEFDLLTLGRSIGNAIYKNLPTDMVYRRTTQSEIDDILESGVFRKLPEGKVAGKGKTFTINGKTVTLHKKGGNAHGGKAFSKGEPWRGTTVTGTADETIIGIPGKGTQWKVGHHGDYSDYVPFENIEKGKGLWEPFNEKGIVENISPNGMRVFRPFIYGHKEDGLLPITGLNLIGENIDQYAEGGEVIGPPTEEQWYDDITKYNPTILDNASLQWSIDAAKKDLHAQAMRLPGYAPMWNNYMKALPKEAPDINEFVDQLWEYENPDNVGYNKSKKKYYPHKSPEGGKMTIGPGFKLGSGQHNITEREAKQGVTKARLNQEARRSGNNYFKAVDKALNKGQTTNPADTVSKQMKYGLADILHQTGSLDDWPKLLNAVRNGDLENIKKESVVTWKDSSGKVHEDTRRNDLRNKNNWHY